MFLLLLNYLHSLGLKIPSVFFYASTRIILASITTLIFTIFIGPFFIKKLYFLKIGQNVRSEKECPLLSQLHEKKQNTPTMGGILIVFSLIASLFLWMDLKNTFTWILLLTTVWMGLIGGVDDYKKLKYKNSKGLSGKYKFLWQIIFGILISSYFLIPAVNNFVENKLSLKAPVAKEYVLKETGLKKAKIINTQNLYSRFYVPFYKNALFSFQHFFLIFVFIFYIFIITGTTNAVNLTDGLDGLAIGCVIMTSAVLGLFAFLSSNLELAKYLNILYIAGSSEIAIYLFALAGASLGFLWYNCYPAQVFMGDTGALSLGGILGVSSILIKKEMLLAIVGGIFVMEAVSVILQVLSYKFRNKKRIFLCAPLHHHYEYKGLKETKVVVRFWIISFLLAVIGIASIKFQ